MKIAVLSDIHSNVFALEAVIDDAKKRNVEQLLNLGDIFYGPIAPMATYNLLKKHNFITIRGNQDRQIYETSLEENDLHSTLKFVIDQLGEEPINWMRNLPFDCQLNDEIYLCHGSPTNDLEYLLENIESGVPCLRTDREILKSLNGQSSHIVLCGHTHIPRIVEIATGQIVINPGSVGLPAYSDDKPIIHSMENYCPHASYTIIEKFNNKWAFQQIKVSYDYQKATSAAAERKRQDWEHCLKTGRVSITD